MTIYSMFVEECVNQPSADLMEKAYKDYVDDSEHPTAASIKEKSAPCKDPSIANQCAVRMSIALARCGFDLEGFQPRRRVHVHNHACQQTIPTSSAPRSWPCSSRRAGPSTGSSGGRTSEPRPPR